MQTHLPPPVRDRSRPSRAAPPERRRPRARAVREIPATLRPGRIAGLDGLRALAVVAVVAFHLWPSGLPGGFLGVDAFFVISGFLITTLLLRERRAAGRGRSDRGGSGIDLRAFWVRRARRLVPPLLVVVVVSLAAAWLVDPDLLVSAPRQVLGALTFSTNWIEVGAGADYFDHRTPTLFATLWSLAVEEQFYVVWPLAFVAAARSRRPLRTLARAAACVAAASALWMGVRMLLGSSVTRVYYGTDTHVFGLMLGVALAYAAAGGAGVMRARRWQRIRIWLGFAGAALFGLLVLLVSSDAGSTYPVGLLLGSLATVAMVAALPGGDSAFVRALDTRPLRWIGERSYGIYLWHWPVLLVVGELVEPGRTGSGTGPIAAGVTIGLTLGLSALTHRFVETPVRLDGVGPTLGRVVLSVRPDPTGGRRHLAARAAVGAAAVVTLLAVVALVSAPTDTDAEASVDAGLRAIAAQQRPEPIGNGSTEPIAAAGSPTGAAAQPAAGPGDAAPTTTMPDALAGPAWPAGQAVPLGSQMIGFGDSVMSGAAPALYQRFGGIYLDAKPIRQWKDAPASVRRALDAGILRRVVVINYGTNAGLEGPNSQAALRKVLDMIGPRRRVVIFEVVGVSDWVPSTNATLHEIAAGYPNVAVAPWNEIANTFPGLLHRDRTHPNMQGIQAYAELLSQTLAKLGPGN